MKDKIRTILESLKELKIPVSRIEKELGFSNGLLGKGSLSDERFEMLQKYADLKLNGIDRSKEPDNLTEPHNPQMVVKKTGAISLAPSNEQMEKSRTLMEKMNKTFGEGTIMFFGDKPKTGYDVVSTGSVMLDRATGIGGLPLGRIIEIFGQESCGKTTIALHVIANAQKRGLPCLLIDAENSFDPEYAAAIGVDIDKIKYCQPSCGEEGLEVIDMEILSGNTKVVVVDSVAALVPKAELEGAMGDSKLGLHARLMSQACRKLINTVAKQGALLIFINQIRNKIGVIYGSPEVTTGGMALQFYASMRLSVTRSTSNENSIMNGDIKTGNLTTVKIVKNKCCPPFKIAKFNIIYGVGIDTDSDIIDAAIESNIIQKSGSWYSYNSDKLGQGKDAVRQLLQDNEELLQELKSKIHNQK